MECAHCRCRPLGNTEPLARTLTAEIPSSFAEADKDSFSSMRYLEAWRLDAIRQVNYHHGPPPGMTCPRRDMADCEMLLASDDCSDMANSLVAGLSAGRTVHRRRTVAANS